MSEENEKDKPEQTPAIEDGDNPLVHEMITRFIRQHLLYVNQLDSEAYFALYEFLEGFYGFLELTFRTMDKMAALLMLTALSKELALLMSAFDIEAHDTKSALLPFFDEVNKKLGLPLISDYSDTGKKPTLQ